jgi:UDP-N-acetylglucosamine--N-acetylmuramyl-(pentapeptide) pyrophosphoryl-undecaprenol N-acetylglucosamine transferase
MTRSTPLRILICTGHTGGHFFPAISFAEAFSKEHSEVEIHMLMSRMSSFAQAYVSRFQIHVIPCSAPPPFFSFKMVLFLLEYARVFWDTVLLFWKLTPRLVAGFGSYSSVPGVLCGVLFHVPVLLHEQNVVPGRANRFLSFLVNRIATSFPDAHGSFPSKKVFWAGYPLRPSFWDVVRAQEGKGETQKPFTILIVGGSQGARRLNETFLEFFRSLGSEERAHFAVIHITGSADFESVKTVYRQLNAQVQVFDFSHNMVELYRKTNLVISRSGAGTIFELAALGKPAILVPYPHAYGHQKQNAVYLAEKQAAWMIEEKDLSCKILREAILTLYQDSGRRQQFEANIKRLTNREAGHILAENTWSLMCKKN